MGGSRVRSPLVEELLRQGQFLLPGQGRALSGTEKSMLRTVFGQSVNLDPIRLVFSQFHVNQRAYTLGNVIRAPIAIPLDSRTLVHECAHVWQYQTRGSGYISDSILHQAASGQGAYAVTIVPGQSIIDYGAEQQATIIEYYFMNDPAGWRTDPDVVRMMEEVRAMRPITEAQHQEDLLYGPGGRPPDQFPRRPEEQITPVVPLIRWEF